MMLVPEDKYLQESDYHVLKQAAEILQSLERVKGAESYAAEQAQILANFTNKQLSELKENLSRRTMSDVEVSSET